MATEAPIGSLELVTIAHMRYLKWAAICFCDRNGGSKPSLSISPKLISAIWIVCQKLHQPSLLWTCRLCGQNLQVMR